MYSFVKKGLYCALIVGGLSAIGAGVANAAEAPETSGTDGIVSGTQVVLDAVLPVTTTGNAISLIGDSGSTDAAAAIPADPAPAAPAEPAAAEPAPATTDGSDSTAGGTQAVVDAVAPVTVSGNAISVVGDSTSTDATTTAAEPAPSATSGTSTDGSDSTAGGTQAVVDAVAPVTANGNAISVFGDSSSTGSTVAPAGNTADGSSDGANTTGTDGLLSGSQVVADAAAPVTANGNAISVLGDSNSTDSTVTPASNTNDGSSDGATTTGTDGLLSGSQVGLDVVTPVTLSGNAISVLGDSTSTDATTTSTADAGTSSGARTGSAVPTAPVTPLTPITPAGPITTTVTTATAPTATHASIGTVASASAGRLPTGLASTGTDPALLLTVGLAVTLGGLLLAGLRRRQELTVGSANAS